jgi:hypothetical protein
MACGTLLIWVVVIYDSRAVRQSDVDFIIKKEADLLGTF